MVQNIQRPWNYMNVLGLGLGQIPLLNAENRDLNRLLQEHQVTGIGAEAGATKTSSFRNIR
jgi:hypothetical protein